MEARRCAAILAEESNIASFLRLGRADRGTAFSISSNLSIRRLFNFGKDIAAIFPQLFMQLEASMNSSSGINIDVRAPQPTKVLDAPAFMFFNFGKDIDCNWLHPAKQSDPPIISNSGKDIVTRLLHA
jgi:hypothetical protein